MIPWLKPGGGSCSSQQLKSILLERADEARAISPRGIYGFFPLCRQGAKLPARIPGLKVSIAVIAEA